MRNTTKVVAALGAAGLVIAGGTAFTASNTVANSVAGYGTSTVTGATVSAVNHTLNGDGTLILSTLLTFSSTQELNTVKAGFGTDALTACTVAGTPFLTATCTWGNGTTTGQTTSVPLALNVAVSK